MRNQILCIEDDETIQILVQHSLLDHQVTFASNLKEAELALNQRLFDAILLDIQLPDGDGIKFYSKIIQEPKFREVPALFLSGNSDISNKVLALSIGADDFITKPFNPLELNIRVSSKIKKRQHQQLTKPRVLGKVEVDFEKQKVFFENEGKQKDLMLTTIEFKIFSLLSNKLERVYGREQIIDEVWGDTHISIRTVDSHIAHLRNKLGGTGISIESVKNSGYRAVTI